MGLSNSGFSVGLCYPFEDGGEDVIVKKKVGTDNIYEVCVKKPMVSTSNRKIGYVYFIVAQTIEEYMAIALKTHIEKRQNVDYLSM